MTAAVFKNIKAQKWRGPHGWRGAAVAGYEQFAFNELPWDLRKPKTSESGNIDCVKASRSRKVLRIGFQPDRTGKSSGAAFAKRYLINNWRRRLGNRLTGGKAEREFALGWELIKMGLPTPRPLAWATHLRPHRAGDAPVPLPPASYLLTREWPNQGSVYDWLVEGRSDGEAFARALARFIAMGHERGFYHDDLAAGHVLVAVGVDPARARFDTPARAPFAYLDIDHGRFEAEPVSMRRRVVNLYQILRSIPFKAFSTRMRKFFVEQYLQAAELEETPSRKALCEAIENLARRKIGASVFNRGKKE